jgi:hypothetical protein
MEEDEVGNCMKIWRDQVSKNFMAPALSLFLVSTPSCFFQSWFSVSPCLRGYSLVYLVHFVSRDRLASNTI